MYTATDKMADLLTNEPQVLQIAAGFRLPLGVGDKTIGEICVEQHIHTNTFLTVVNYKMGQIDNNINYEDLSLNALIDYLRNTHSFFFDFSLPLLRRKLIEATNHSSVESKVPMLIIRFFDEYVNEISLHMQHENDQMFPYVESLLRGEKTDNFTIEQFANQHRAIDDVHIANKLTELKNLIVKYYPNSEDNNLLLSALNDIFHIETMLATHCSIEDEILLPAVRYLEKHKKKINKANNLLQNNTEELSDREKEVLIEVVKGLSNKEIADVLFISTHTVISHRKNITRKLNIHSTAGLTIYAIVNNLIDINNLA